MALLIRDLPNVPCSAERSEEGSEEGSVIFCEFSVPLFKGGAGKVWGTFIIPILSYFIFTQVKKIYKFKKIQLVFTYTDPKT